MLGKPVPDFSLPSTGRSSLDPTFQLSTTRGSKVVLYFHPHGTTGFLTGAIRDPYLDLRRVGRHVFGISRDSLGSHARFKEKIRFPFELLVDPDAAVCEQFGVMKHKLMYGKKVRGITRSRHSSLGGLARQWRGVKVPGHIQEVLNFVKAL